MAPITLLKRSIVLVAILLGALTNAYSQNFYVNTSDGALVRVTIANNGLTYLNVPGCGSGYFSIAIFKNTLYYNQSFGTLSKATLTDNGTPIVTDCVTLPVTASANSLTIDKDEVIYYAAGNQLYSIAPGAASAVFLGSMPYSAAGDLVFYNDELYMAAGEGIVKIPLTDPSAATLHIPMPGKTIYGLSTILKTGVLKVYALAAGVNGGTDLIELDMEAKTVKSTIGNLPFTVYDAASSTEAGEIPVIKRKETKVNQDCGVINKGAIQVITEPHTSEYTYTLNNGQSSRDGIITNLSPGNYHLIITSNGGELPDESDFTVPDYSLNNPVVTALRKNPVCDVPGEITLNTATGTTTYSIRYNNQVYEFGHAFTGLPVGTYHFEIINKNGCLIDEKDYELVQDVCPPIEITGTQLLQECTNYNKAIVTVLTKPHPDTYTYSFNGITGLSNSFNNVPSGTYTLVVTSSGGDRKEQQVFVPDMSVVNKPALMHTVRNAVCTALGQITFAPAGDAKGAAKIKHGTDVSPLTQTIKGLVPGSNHFTVLTAEGCILDELDIETGQDPCDMVTFPNTFTPNGDGVNDVFRPDQSSNAIGVEYFIYNRYGQQFFHSRSLNIGWDGNYGGKQATTGVYYLVVKYTMPDGLSYINNTSVTLLR